jgi:hypothetical protein
MLFGKLGSMPVVRWIGSVTHVIPLQSGIFCANTYGFPVSFEEPTLDEGELQGIHCYLDNGGLLSTFFKESCKLNFVLPAFKQRHVLSNDI